jgi:hyperosmotically inducible protein
MKHHSLKSLRLSALVIALLAINGTTFAADDLSSDITEARQETQIWTTYALSPYLQALDLKVSVDDGKATLSGITNEEVNKELAKQIALGVKGIKSVDNQIEVQADYVAPEQSAEPSYGDIIDDASITAAVKSKLLWSKYADGLSTEVSTSAGKVTLTGTADSPSARQHAVMLTKNTQGVVAVDNQLQIETAKPGIEATTKDAMNSAEQAISDSWITTKVKSSLLYSSNVSGSNISVSTKDGVVTLTGSLSSGPEQALAIEISHNVRGVKSVESKGLVFDTPTVSMQ